MPKLGMQPIRRRQLIDATLDAINEVGMHDATIAQIARRAGVSTGIISHYFKDKNGLLEATMRDITSQSARRGAQPSARSAGRQRQPAPAGDCRRQL